MAIACPLHFLDMAVLEQMVERLQDAVSSDADDYRDRARRLRVRAAMMKSRGARADLGWLAAEYETFAAQLAATEAPTKVGERTKDKGDDPGLST